MGRPAIYPQGQDLVNLVNKHPDLSYAEIWKHYGFGGNPSSFKGACHRAGVRRYKDYLRGGGPLDEGVMSHDDFWNHVDTVGMPQILAKIRAKAERSPQKRAAFHDGRDRTNDGDSMLDGRLRGHRPYS